MNKADLVKAIASKARMNQASAQKALEVMLDTFKDSLKKGTKIQLIGFGSFEVAKRAARKGVNPQSKKPINIPAKKVVKFKPGKELKEIVAKSK
ncbi:MAG: HU family DNA-binding protein [Candidatus Riflebacteria bacterium]|nr:HU family DNA-binding protein [Candidatus Riflebacteria bacterium]